LKRVFIIVFLAWATMAVAQHDAPQWSDDCLYTSAALGLPAHYCACHEGSDTFQFPLDRVLTDTVWYTASVNDLKQGLSAYWFADCSVTMEVFAFCTSKVPTFTITVGKNRMVDVDVDYINSKLDEMGETAQMLAQTLTPHLRVYPNGGTGRVYCYPYDQGPLSTCEDPLPLRPGMVYVCDKEENAYRMEWDQIAQSGKAFIHWLQKESEPCELWLTLDSCTGEEIGRAVLTDSLHVFQPEAAVLTAVRNEGRTLWLHVKHDAGIVGRVTWFNNPVYVEPLETVTGVWCEGKTVTFSMRTYDADTAFVDTVWVNRDTLTSRDVDLTFTPAVTEYDTVYVKQVDLNRGYRYAATGDVFHAFGDYDLWIRKAGTCTRHIALSIMNSDAPKEAMETVKEPSIRAIKQLQDGHIIILLNNSKYNLLGQLIY